MLILSLASFRPTTHIGVDRIRPNVLPMRRSCYARFGRCERGLAKYTRCVSVAARGVASSLLCAISTAGRLVWGHRHPALSLSFSYVWPSPFLLFAVSFIPSRTCLSPFVALSFSSFVFVRGIRTRLGWANFEAKYMRVRSYVRKHGVTEDVITTKLRNDARVGCIDVKIKKPLKNIFFT